MKLNLHDPNRISLARLAEIAAELGGLKRKQIPGLASIFQAVADDAVRRYKQSQPEREKNQ